MKCADGVFRAAQNYVRFACNTPTAGRDADFVLSTRSGRPFAQRNLQRAIEAAAVSAGLGKVTPHDLRRSFASLAARRGVDPVQAARMTGHSLDVWTRHYAGDYGKSQRDEARKRLISSGFGAGTAEVRDHQRDHAASSVASQEDENPPCAAGSSVGAPRFELGTSSPPD